jgi:hypothetical protein
MASINLLQRQINKIVDYLAEQGEKVIRNAAQTKETQNRKKNQLDAYGWCVYYKGEKKKQGFLTPNRTADQPHNAWAAKGYDRTFGRDDVTMFFDNYKPESNGFILVCVNAVFYTTIQEFGGAQRKYRIISQVAGDMQGIANKFKGARIYSTL